MACLADRMDLTKTGALSKATCAGDGSEWRFLPTEIPGSREPGLRLPPQLGPILAKMRAELSSPKLR